MKKSLLLTTVFTTIFTVPLTSYAFDCETAQPSCSALGYNKTSAECEDVSKLRCPFDYGKAETASSFFCIPKPAEPCVVNNCSFDGCTGSVKVNCDLWKGKENTDAIIAQFGNDAIAAKACREYSPAGVAPTHPVFGKGHWYLPAIGEWLDVYGSLANIDLSETGDNLIVRGSGVEDHLGPIADTLANLGSQFHTNDYLISSTDHSSEDHIWSFNPGYGGFGGSHGTTQLVPIYKRLQYDNDHYIAYPFLLIENVEQTFPGVCYKDQVAVGDIVYDDGSRSRGDCIDPTRTPVGVVVWTSIGSGGHGRSIKIMGLNPPYVGRYANASGDITGVTNYNSSSLRSSYQGCTQTGWPYTVTETCFGEDYKYKCQFKPFVHEGYDWLSTDDSTERCLEEISKDYDDDTASLLCDFERNTKKCIEEVPKDSDYDFILERIMEYNYSSLTTMCSIESGLWKSCLCDERLAEWDAVNGVCACKPEVFKYGYDSYAEGYQSGDIYKTKYIRDTSESCTINGVERFNDVCAFDTYVESSKCRGSGMIFNGNQCITKGGINMGYCSINTKYDFNNPSRKTGTFTVESWKSDGYKTTGSTSISNSTISSWGGNSDTGTMIPVLNTHIKFSFTGGNIQKVLIFGNKCYVKSYGINCGSVTGQIVSNFNDLPLDRFSGLNSEIEIWFE